MTFLSGYYPTEADWGEQTDSRKFWLPLWILVVFIILYFTIKGIR